MTRHDILFVAFIFLGIQFICLGISQIQDIMFVAANEVHQQQESASYNILYAFLRVIWYLLLGVILLKYAGKFISRYKNPQETIELFSPDSEKPLFSICLVIFGISCFPASIPGLIYAFISRRDDRASVPDYINTPLTAWEGWPEVIGATALIVIILVFIIGHNKITNAAIPKTKER